MTVDHTENKWNFTNSLCLILFCLWIATRLLHNHALHCGFIYKRHIFFDANSNSTRIEYELKLPFFVSFLFPATTKRIFVCVNFLQSSSSCQSNKHLTLLIHKFRFQKFISNNFIFDLYKNVLWWFSRTTNSRENTQYLPTINFMGFLLYSQSSFLPGKKEKKTDDQFIKSWMNKIQFTEMNEWNNNGLIDKSIGKFLVFCAFFALRLIYFSILWEILPDDDQSQTG